MAKKSFEIQGTKLRIGGLDLEAGLTGVVIPGVTQATTYFVEEVDDNVRQISPNDPPNEFNNPPVIIDSITYNDYLNTGTSTDRATYTCEIDDNEIDEVDVNTAGIYSASEADRNANADLWAYTGTEVDPFAVFTSSDWVEISFRPKMRVGEVENIGGGGSGLPNYTGEFIGNILTINTTIDNTTPAINDTIIDLIPTTTLNANDWIGSGTNDPGTYATLRLSNGITYEITGWNTDANGDSGFLVIGAAIDLPGEQIWPITITSYNYQEIPDGKAIEVGNYTWKFNEQGNMLAPGDITTGFDGQGGRFIQDCADGTTSMRWINVNQGNNSTQLIRAYTGDPDLDNEVERAQIKLNWDETEDKSGLTIRTFDDSDDSTNHDWKFRGDGGLEFPDGSIQVTAYTGDNSSTGDNKIWIETFASDQSTTDFVQSAISVEYDTAGNIIALFNHYVPSNNYSTYTSVAKLTPTGAVLWQIRFAGSLNTDGWGLAYDTVDNYVYVAGKISGTPLTYEFATLTKLSGINGTVIWSKSYDFEANSSSAVVDVDSAGNPIMVGYAYNGTDNYIVTSKINKTDGSVLWSKTLNGQGSDEAYGMAVGPTNEIVTIGYVDTFGLQNVVSAVVAEPGSNVNWTNERPIFNGGFSCVVSFPNGDGIPSFSNIEDTIGNRAIGDTLATILGSNLGDNGVDGIDDMIIKVDTLSANDDTDRMVVIKYDTDGTIAWQKAVQFDVGFDCSGADADIDTDGNIYVCGQYRYDLNPGTTSAMSLVKFDSSGVKQWSRRVVGACDTFSTSVVVGDDNYLYLSGITLLLNNNNQDYIWAVAKYDTFGTVVWQRLIDNTTTWSFGGSFWTELGGGSNIAVREGYIALAGGFGDPGIQPTAVVVQIDTDATLFSVGDWDIKVASFSGLFDDAASDINVIDADKDIGFATPSVNDFLGEPDSSNFLTITRYGITTSSSGLETIIVPAISGIDYKGFRASYGRIYDNTNATELNVNKIIIHKPVDTTITIDPTGDTDDFKVIGLGESDIVAMFILYGDVNGDKSEATLRTFVETAIDNIILFEGTEGNINSLSIQRDNFNDPTIAATLAAAAGGLFTDFLFYETYTNTINDGVTTVREGSGAVFTIDKTDTTSTTSSMGDIVVATQAFTGFTAYGYSSTTTPTFGSTTGPLTELYYSDEAPTPSTSLALTPGIYSGFTVSSRGLIANDTITHIFNIGGIEVSMTPETIAPDVYVYFDRNGDSAGLATKDTQTVAVSINYSDIPAETGDYSIEPGSITDGGTNYLVGHKILVLGTSLGGATPDNDAVITVSGATGGEITEVTITGTPTGTTAQYTAVTGTNYNVGSGFALWDVYINNNMSINLSIRDFGSNYVVGDVITLPGTNLTNGTSPLNDFTITITSLSGGAPSNWNVTGTLPIVWRTDYIQDGGRDQYDDGNFITTNLGIEIDYNGGNIVEDGQAAFGVGSSYSFVYQPGIFGLLVTGNSATFLSTEGGSGADGNSTTDTGNLYYPGSPAVTYDNAVRYLNIVNNPTIEFTKLNYGDQIDILIPDDGEGGGVGITRGNNQGIYNPYRDEGWTQNISPSGTEWNIDGWADLSNITSRTYDNLYDAFGSNENLGNNIVGTECVMYVPDNGKYYTVKFTEWTQNNQGGGFAYIRRELDVADPTRADGIRFSDGTIQTTAAIPETRVKLSSPGNRRIEDVSGYKSITVLQTGLISLNGIASRASDNTNIIWINITSTTIDEIVNDMYNVNSGNYVNNSLEFSLDNNTWYTYSYNGWTTDDNERGYEINSAVTYTQGDTIYFRYRLNPVSAIWWDKNTLPSGGNNFRGAVIDYHAFTGEATFIGTIHIVDDDGDENITHTEVSSGGTSSENDDLWYVTNEGNIRYRRTDGQGATVRVQWTARVFYGNETYD